MDVINVYIGLRVHGPICPGLHVGVCGRDQGHGRSHGPSFPTKIHKTINGLKIKIVKIKVGNKRKNGKVFRGVGGGGSSMYTFVPVRTLIYA